MIKKTFAIITVFTLMRLLTMNILASNLTPTPEFFVNDYANVLSDESEKEIVELGTQLEKATDAQVVIITVETIGNKNIRQYAVDIGNKWGIGDAQKNNGVLIFLAVNDRTYSIEVGYGLEGALPDATCSRIQREVMNPYFSKDQFSEGMLAGYRKICALVYKEYNVEIPSGLEIEECEVKSPVDREARFLAYLILMFSFYVFRVIIRIIERRRLIANGFEVEPFFVDVFIGAIGSGRGSSGGGGHFGGGGSSSHF